MTLFDKPAQSIDQHLDTLRQRGLAISDEARARHYLLLPPVLLHPTVLYPECTSALFPAEDRF